MTSYQFLGYWRSDHQERSCQQLIAALQAAPSIWGEHHTTQTGQGEKYAWGVGYLGRDSSNHQTCHEILARISASGLPNNDDAWVKVVDRSLILGRDVFGRVPLYWTVIQQSIWFASQLQLLLCLVKLEENPQVNLLGLYGYTCFSYVPTPLTTVANIFAVPVGKELIWRSPQEEPTYRHCYEWREHPQVIQQESEAIAQLQTLLQTACERQISDLKDEPVGVFLSGGLDSATVAALLVKAGVKVRAYTLDFACPPRKGMASEAPYAQQVAEHLQIPLVKVDASPQRVKQAIAATVQALDQPYGDGVAVPLWLLNQAASQEVAVVFNGEGGDQLFGGWTNKPLIAAGIYNSDERFGKTNFLANYLRTFHRLHSYEQQTFSSEIYQHIINNPNYPAEWLTEALDSQFCPSLLHQLRRANLILKGAQNIQPRASNLAFAWGLQVRSLFCDLPLAEWTFQLPGEFCLQGACEKYLLKQAVNEWLPSAIVWREKRGMGVPLTWWCLEELWQELGIWLHPQVLASEGRFKPELAWQVAMGKLSGHIQGRRIGEILWLLLMWQVWRTQVLGEDSPKLFGLHCFLLSPRTWRWFSRAFLPRQII